MSDFKPGDSVTVGFATSAFATGILTAADTTPVGTLNRNGTDDGAVTVTVTSISTGRYKAVFTIPSTYAAGDVLNLWVAATVATLTGGANVWTSRVGAGLGGIPAYVFNSVWLDTTNGTTGTVNYVNGTAVSPSDTLAHASTIAASLGIKRFKMIPETSVTLVGNYRDYLFDGDLWTIALGGEDVSGCTINNATVSGTALAASAPPLFTNCTVGTTTLPPCTLANCGLTGTITVGTGGLFHLLNCSNGSTSPAVIDLGATHTATTFQLRNWQGGGVTVKHLLAGDSFSIDGMANLTIDTTCTGGTVGVHGTTALTNNGTGVTISQTARISTDNTTNTFTVAAVTGNVGGNLGGSVVGDVQGKVLGGGSSIITGLAVWADDSSGNALATASAVSTLQTSVNNLNNLSALANLFAPSTLVRPATSSIAYPFTFVVKDSEGHLVDVDSNTVTLTAANTAGTDRSSNLSAVTHLGTGEYTFSYTVQSTAVDEGLRITAAGTVQSATRKAYANCDVADADSLTSLAAIQAQTDKMQFDGSNNIKANVQVGAPTVAQIATGVWQDTTSGDFTVNSSIGKSLYTGVVPGNQFGGLVTNNTAFLPAAIVTGGSVSFSGGITANINGNLSGSIGSYTGNTPQTGDAYAVVNNVTFGNAALATLINAIGTIVSAIQAVTNLFSFTGGNVNARAAVVADKTGYELDSTANTAIQTAVWAIGIDGTYNAKQYLKAAASGAAGPLSGGPGPTLTFKTLDNAATTFTCTVDASGDRSGFSYNL